MHLFVGADAHIGLLRSYEFAEDYRKNSAFCLADVGIGPYGLLRSFPLAAQSAARGAFYCTAYRCSCTYRFTRLWIMLAVVWTSLSPAK